MDVDAPTLEAQAPRATARPAGNRPGRAGGVAFVFQGGGSLTAPQVGMLRALREAGPVPDLVIGSSAGAISAVTFATDPGPAGLDRLEAVWTSLRRRHVAPLSARALLASCAFPGLYPPVRVGGRLLVDGGVSADVPVLQAEALDATVTYVLPAAVCDVAQSLPRGPLPGTRTGRAASGLLTNQAGASEASAMSRSALRPRGVHGRTAARPPGSYLRRAVSAFPAEMPGSEVVTAWLRPGSAR